MDSHLLLPHHPGLRLVFGSMTFADQVDEENAIKQLETFFSFHPADQYVEVDTAYMYAGTKTEQMLGKILTDDQRSRMRIATKGTLCVVIPHSELHFHNLEMLFYNFIKFGQHNNSKEA